MAIVLLIPYLKVGQCLVATILTRQYTITTGCCLLPFLSSTISSVLVNPLLILHIEGNLLLLNA